MLRRSIQSCNVLQRSLAHRCVAQHTTSTILPYTNNITRHQLQHEKKLFIATSTINHFSSNNDFVVKEPHNNESQILQESSDYQQYQLQDSEEVISTLSYGGEEESSSGEMLHEYQTTLLQLSKQNKPREAARLLSQMPTLDPPIQPDTSCFNIVLKACIDNGDINRAMEIFLTMQKETSNNDTSLVLLDDISINTMLHGLANNEIRKNREKVVELFKKLKQPNSSSYNALFKVHSDNQRSIREIPNILKDMKTNGVIADAYTHAIIVQAYINVGLVKEAFSYLSFVLETRIHTTQISIHPFSTLIHCLALRGDVNAAIQVFNKIPKPLKPHTLIYNSMIDVHCRTRDVSKAEAILNQMIKDYKSGTNTDVSPSFFSFSAVITSYAKNNQPYRAQEVLQEMISLHRHNSRTDVVPTLQLCNSIISSWARVAQNDDKAPFQAKTFLQQMHTLSRDIPTLDPDVRAYTNVILTFSNCNRLDIPIYKREILQLYRKMNELDQSSTSNVVFDSLAYNNILNAMTKCCISTTKIENGVEYNYSDVIKIVKEVLHKMTTDEKVKPDIISYNSVINSFAKIGEADTAHKLLSNLLKSTSSIKPDIYTFNIVLHAYAIACRNNPQSTQYAQLAEGLLKEMMNDTILPYPDNYSFNSVIDAWSKLEVEERGQNADKILDMMMDLYKETANEKCKPDLRSYTGVIHACGKTNDTLRAQTIFQKLKTSGLTPTTYTYNCLINVISKSRDTTMSKKAMKTLQYLEEMKEQNVPRDVFTYNFTLSACAFTLKNDEKKEAFQIAKRVMNLLNEDRAVVPEEYTFVILLDVYTNLLPYSKNSESENYMEEVFNNARDRGLVGDFVLKRLKNILDVRLYNRLIPNEIPRQWSRNVKRNNRRPR